MMVAMQKRALPTLFFTIFLDMVGVGILIPIIPILLADPASPHYLLPLGTSKETGYILLGALMAVYSLGQFLAAPVIGQLSDKFGRKKLLLVSIVGSVLAHVFFAIGIMTKSLPLLFVVRLLGGIAAGNIVVSQAAIADITTPENRSKNFGLIGAAFGLGFIIGPFIGGKLADASLVSWFSAATPFWFAALLSLVNLVFVAFMFRETNQHINPTTPLRLGKALTNVLHAFNAKQLRPIFLTSFLFQMGFAFYMTFSNVFLFDRFGFNEGSIGNYFAYIGLWIVFTQAVVTRTVSKKWTEVAILRNSIIAVGIFNIAIFLTPHASWLYFIVPFFAMSIGLTQTNLTGLLSRSAGPAMQGEVLGINGSLNALAMTFPPLLAGTVAARFEPSAPLLVSAIVIIISGLYFVNHIWRKNRVSL
jgi:DHA1 family tetracycline resistance protein-like MFS transporter